MLFVFLVLIFIEFKMKKEDNRVKHLLLFCKCLFPPEKFVFGQLRFLGEKDLEIQIQIYCFEYKYPKFGD
jgi:hypothetical protein